MRTGQIILKESDLLNIGHTSMNVDDKVKFICSSKTFSIELILLRSILAITGHKIINQGDFLWDNNTCDWFFQTNFPYVIYEKMVTEAQ